MEGPTSKESDEEKTTPENLNTLILLYRKVDEDYEKTYGEIKTLKGMVKGLRKAIRTAVSKMDEVDWVAGLHGTEGASQELGDLKEDVNAYNDKLKGIKKFVLEMKYF